MVSIGVENVNEDDLVSVMLKLLFSELVGREGELFHPWRAQVLVVFAVT